MIISNVPEACRTYELCDTEQGEYGSTVFELTLQDNTPKIDSKRFYTPARTVATITSRDLGMLISIVRDWRNFGPGVEVLADGMGETPGECDCHASDSGYYIELGSDGESHDICGTCEQRF